MKATKKLEIEKKLYNDSFSQNSAKKQNESLLVRSKTLEQHDLVEVQSSYSNKLDMYSNYLSKNYKSFNRNLLVDKLECGYRFDESFHIKVPNEFRYITRKHQINHENVEKICEDIIDDDKIDEKTKLQLALGIKHSIKNGLDVKLETLIKVLEKSNSIDVRSEIAHGMANKIKKSQFFEELTDEQIAAIDKIELKTYAKDFLNSQIQKKQNTTTKTLLYSNKVKLKTNHIPQATVSKNQVKIKFSYGENKSELEKVRITSLAERLNTKGKKAVTKSSIENLPIIQGGNGDDRSFWSGTYVNVKNLYQRAARNQEIKLDDKDKYLVAKFLQNSEKWYAGGLVGSLLIDRMIAATFVKISGGNRNRQILSNAALDKLLILSGNISEVKRLMFGDKNGDTIANQFRSSWKPSENLNKIEKQLTDKISETKEISKIIDEEVENLRSDSIEAVYNNVILTQGKCLTKERIEKIKGCLDDKNLEVRKFAIRICSRNNDSEIPYSKLFDIFLDQLKVGIDIDQSIEYTYSQTTDPNRCKELFNYETLFAISSLLNSEKFEENHKKICCQIINNYLEYGFVKGLDDRILENIVTAIKNPNSSHELKSEALVAILLTAEKEVRLPVRIIDFLINELPNFDEKTSCFVIITLGSISKKEPIVPIDKISMHLSNEKVIMGFGKDIVFEDRSKDNIDYTSVSSIVAEICHNSLEQKVKASISLANDLILGLDSSEKQTSILSAKSLYIIAQNDNVFDNEMLLKIREYVNHDIRDLEVYSKAVYAGGLAKLSSKTEGALGESHIDLLPIVYATRDLLLEDRDFAAEVNENILSILLSESAKQKFNDEVFEIINHILDSSGSYQLEATQIIYKQAKLKCNIPNETICLLENTLDETRSDMRIYDSALGCFEKIIKNRQVVGDKVLQIFTDDLYLSDDISKRRKAFELLDIADSNQDLPDEIFEKLELERAGISISQNLDDKTDAISYLKKKTEEGHRLPINSLLSLGEELHDRDVLLILVNVSQNKQFIPLVDQLVNKFIQNPENHSYIIDIFIGISNNNQDIPNIFLDRLKPLINTMGLLSDKALLIFINTAQKDYLLSKEIINKICERFLDNTNIQTRKNQISSIVSNLKKQDNIDYAIIEKALISGLNDENDDILRITIEGFKSLSAKDKISKLGVGGLVVKAIDIDCEEGFRKDIIKILDDEELNKQQKGQIKLVKANDRKGNFLEKLNGLSKKHDLLQRNFIQLKSIIDEDLDSDKKDKAIEILLNCKNKKDIPDELIKRIITLERSTISTEQKNICKNLISQIEEFTGRVIVQEDPQNYSPIFDLGKSRIEDLLHEKFIIQISDEYLSELSSKINDKFTINISDKLLRSIKEIDNLQKFESLIDFAHKNKIQEQDIYSKGLTVSELLRSLEIKLLGNKIDGRIDRARLGDVIDRLINNNWDFNKLEVLFDKIKSDSLRDREKRKLLIPILEIIDNYKISPSPVNYRKIITSLDSESENWLAEINKIAVENNFDAIGVIKNNEELIRELRGNNSGNESLSQLVGNNFLKMIEEINSNQLKSQSLSAQPISEWREEHILEWTKKVKSNHDYFKNPDFTKEALAVIKRANKLHTGFDMTSTQIMSCIVAVNSNQDQGRLLQVATGEGKSTIVSVLAIFNALQNKKVDIITSSPILAERDAKEKSKLYKMFGLSVSDNNDKSIYIKGPKGCYKKDIVYGEASQFQFDVLRDEYSSLGTLAGRKCEIAIVDEVDSMLIDDSSKIARLSSSIAGMDQLQIIYHFLWQRLNHMQERVLYIDGQLYLLYGKLNYGADNISLEYTDDNGEIFKIDNLKEHIRLNPNISNIGQLIKEDIEVFIKSKLGDYIGELIKKEQIKIPNNFKEFVDGQMPKWINNSILALNYQENIHYVVQSGSIKPVDYSSTGIIQSSTNWSDGLHQFLQLKHNLKMTSESFTTNFLSNMGYFKRYGSNLFGLTGTLGSEKAKEVLSKTYNVDFVRIPNLRKKQYLELNPIVAINQEKWIDEICSSAKNEANKERGILIICETIESAQKISVRLKENYIAEKIKLYIMNDMNQEQEIEKIHTGEIIIATNLAGRGTDIKTDDIEKNGGMHVILTFMPSNERVEQQAFGRTARQGKCGTGQMILSAGDLIEYGNVDPNQIKELRDKLEIKTLEEFEAKELKIIETKDKLFKEFCELLNKIRLDIRKKIREKSGVLKQFKDSVKDLITNAMPSIEENNILAAIEERWAIFLRKIDDGIIPIPNAKNEYEIFAGQINGDYENEKVIKNPYYHIAIANDLVVNDKYELAVKHFNDAIKLDEKFSVAAYVGKCWSILKAKEKPKDYKHQATEEFNKALGILSDEMASLNAIQAILAQNNSFNSDLSRQLIQKTNILGSYLNSIQNSISVIKKSQRLIDIRGIKTYQRENEYIQRGSGQDSTYERSSNYNTETAQKIFYYYENERDENKKIDIKTHDNYDEFEIVFNDLIVREDNGARDQAIETIEECFVSTAKIIGSNAILDKKYKDISLNLRHINGERLQSMLNPNIEIISVTRETAITQLKNNSSFFHRHLIPKSLSSDSYKTHLEIFLDGEKLEEHNVQARDAISIIEKQENDNLRFNINFANANKLEKELDKLLSSSEINIEYLRLDSETARNYLSQIKAKNIEITITGKKEDLIIVIEDKDIETIEFFDDRKNLSESLYKETALRKFSEISDEIIKIKIRKIRNELANQIVGFCNVASFDINFMGINIKESLKSLDYENLNVSFDNLGESEAEKLIKVLRKENIDFGLVFKNLDYRQVEGIIAKASIDQEDIEITKAKPLSEMFMDENKPTIELLEFSARGIEYLLEINEKRFIPWRSIVTVGAIAAVQMAVGGVLVATGFGATVGMGLITEGAADIFTAYRAYSTRQFTWSDYAKQKAVSLAISAVSMGWGKIKDAGKGAQNLIVGVGEEVLEQAGTQVVMNGKAVGKTLVQSGKNLKSLAFKQIGVATGEAAGREVLNKVADSISHLALEQFKPKISEWIQTKVNARFCNPNLMILVSKMYAIDKTIKSQSLKGKIDKIVVETINPEHNYWRKQWDSVGGPLCKGILSDQKYLGGSFSMGIRILGTLNGIHQITYIIDNVYEQMVKKLSQIDRETLSMHQILSQHCKIDQKEACEIVKVFKEEKIIENEFLNPLAFEKEKEFKLSGINQLFKKETQDSMISKLEYHEAPKYHIDKTSLQSRHKSGVIKLCKSLHDNISSMQTEDLSQIMKSVSDVITDQIIRVTESQLISPWSSYGVGILTSSLSNSIQDELIRNSELGQQVLSEKEKELENLLADPNYDENTIKMLEQDIYGKQTYSGLINHEAKKYTIAYSQCENIYHAQQKIKDSANVNNNKNEQVQKHAKEVRKDKPADVADMFTMASLYGINIKIVDDADYQMTEEDKAKNTIPILFTEGGIVEDDNFGKIEGLGHYQLITQNYEEEIGSNNCGYDVISKILKARGIDKSVEQIRNETANAIEANSTNFSKAIDAQNWIFSRYPNEANSLLFRGAGSYRLGEKKDYGAFIRVLEDKVFKNLILEDADDLRSEFGEGEYSMSLRISNWEGNCHNKGKSGWTVKVSMEINVYKNGKIIKSPYKLDIGNLSYSVGSFSHKVELLAKAIGKVMDERNGLPESIKDSFLKQIPSVVSSDSQFFNIFNKNVDNSNNITNVYLKYRGLGLSFAKDLALVNILGILGASKILNGYKLYKSVNGVLNSLQNLKDSKSLLSVVFNLASVASSINSIEKSFGEMVSDLYDKDLKSYYDTRYPKESLENDPRSLAKLCGQSYENIYDAEKDGFKVIAESGFLESQHGVKLAILKKYDKYLLVSEGTNLSKFDTKTMAQLNSDALMASGKLPIGAINATKSFLDAAMKKHGIPYIDIATGHSKGGSEIILSFIDNPLVKKMTVFDPLGVKEILERLGKDISKHNIDVFQSSAIGNLGGQIGNVINVPLISSPFIETLKLTYPNIVSSVIEILNQHKIDNIMNSLQ
jgi:preprotein translocase subunit SecA